jgi:hypothetical protein
MLQVSVGLVPVWTTVGKAVKLPTGIEGLVDWADEKEIAKDHKARVTSENGIGFITGWIGFGFGRKLRLGWKVRVVVNE